MKVLCEDCGKKWTSDPTKKCKACRYQDQVKHEMSLPFDVQDWSFAHCEECGLSLGSDGECHNTWCGNSPDQGKDWL